jgi:hypothetical protein
LQAVRAAIDQGADIISMSWTIERTDTNKADIDELEKAIELAASKDVLMFCAATDQRPFKDRSYPAASGTKKIFKIGAAEASGAALEWIGDQSAVDFIMPGHQVVMERHKRPQRPKVHAPNGLLGGNGAGIRSCRRHPLLRPVGEDRTGRREPEREDSPV